jgi:hypothetical protein
MFSWKNLQILYISSEEMGVFGLKKNTLAGSER